MERCYMKKLENFRKSVSNLKEIYSYEAPYDNAVILTGLIGLFQLSFELSWKAMKESLSAAGFSAAATGSPRSIIKTAYQAGMITDENLWLSMLSDRNDTSHEYDEESAKELIERIKKDYYPELRKLLQELERNWKMADPPASQ